MQKTITLFILLFSTVSSVAQVGKVYPLNGVKKGAVNSYIYEPPAGLEIPIMAWAVAQTDLNTPVSSQLIRKGMFYEFKMQFPEECDVALISIYENLNKRIDTNGDNPYLIRLDVELSDIELRLREIHAWQYDLKYLGEKAVLEKQLEAYEVMIAQEAIYKKGNGYEDYLFAKYRAYPKRTKPEILKYIDYLKSDVCKRNMRLLVPMYEIIGDTANSQKHKQEYKAQYPSIDDAKEVFFERYNQESDKSEDYIVAYKQEFVAQFQKDIEKDLVFFQMELLRYYVKERDAFMMETIEEDKSLNLYTANVYYGYTKEVADQKDTVSTQDLEFAALTGKKAMEILLYEMEHPDFASYTIGYSETYRQYASAYAFVLFQLERYEESFEIWDEMDLDYGLERAEKECYAVCLEKLKGADSAKNYLERELAEGTECPGMCEQLDRIYEQLYPYVEDESESIFDTQTLKNFVKKSVGKIKDATHSVKEMIVGDKKED